MLKSITLASIMSLGAILAGCGGGEVRNASRVDEITTGSVRYEGVRNVSLGSAFVRFPPGANASQVREQVYADGISQQIVLGSGEGAENRMDISIQTVLQRTSGPGGPMSKPTREGIRMELSERFPTVSMQVVTRPMRNAYGPFGLAIGRGRNDVRCIYAWQWIDDTGDVRGSNASVFTKLGVAAGAGSSSSLRFRVCRNGVTVDQLAGLMTGVTITRYAKAIANEPLQRAAGNAPRSLESEISRVEIGPVQSVSPPPAPKRRVRRKPPPEEASVPRQRQATTYESVDQGGVRYLAPVQAGQRQAAPSYPGSPSAPRGGPVIPRPQAQPPSGAPRPPPTRQSLDPSLPAAAYQGPSGQRSAQ